MAILITTYVSDTIVHPSMSSRSTRAEMHDKTSPFSSIRNFFFLALKMDGFSSANNQMTRAKSVVCLPIPFHQGKGIIIVFICIWAVGARNIDESWSVSGCSVAVVLAHYAGRRFVSLHLRNSLQLWRFVMCHSVRMILLESREVVGVLARLQNAF